MRDQGSQIERNNESENRFKAHSWVQQNMEALIVALNASRLDILEVFRKNPDLLDYLPSPGEDVFSAPICEPLMDHFPNSLLGEVKKIWGGAGRENKEIKHSFFVLGDLIIDPTSGQFISQFDKAIYEHPELFEGKVLIATPEEIKKIFKLHYKIPTKTDLHYLPE